MRSRWLRHGRQIRTGFNSCSGTNFLFPDVHAEWSEEYPNTGHQTPGNKWRHPMYDNNRNFVLVQEELN